MASAFETFKDLELNREEVERITDALKTKEFRKLLTDYVEDIKNPENQKIYQEEVTQLEKERGNDVTFINPEAGYVIKTSVDGQKKAFINICSNIHVQKPISSPAVQNGSKGLQWSLPHSLTPPREDVDNKNMRCMVYDVVFHPDTLHLACKNKAFYKMVNETACNAIETNFNVTLDKKNLKFPKLKYKGYPQPAVIRKPSKDKPELTPEDKEIMDKLFAQVETPKTDYSKKNRKTSKKRDDHKSLYTTPEYIIKHCRSYEMEEFVEHKNAKLNTAIPKQLLVEVCLPLLKSSTDIVLDVAEKTLTLISEKPAKYKLSLTLPYKVNHDNGNAKFDKDKKKLFVTLPVQTCKTLLISEKDDSGIDTDHNSIASSPLEEVGLQMEAHCNVVCEQLLFLDPNYQYSLPEFKAHISEDKPIILFTINVKNINETSLKKIVTENDFHIQFTSISSGFYPIHYALYVKLPSSSYKFDIDSIVIDIWDNNLIVQICYRHLCETKKPETILYGLDEHTLNSQNLQTLAQSSTSQSSKQPDNLLVHNEDCVHIPDNPPSVPIDILGTSESSSDEYSSSLSLPKGRGILKYMRNARRTVSESGVDEVKWSLSLENQYTSVDSVIPEEGELSSSLKKTVRFNESVSRKLYRSNSSILGQKKKNQRKSKAKKRAQERRHSESEVSETEERKEGEEKTASIIADEKTDSDDRPQQNFNTEVFELDIN